MKTRIRIFYAVFLFHLVPIIVLDSYSHDNLG